MNRLSRSAFPVRLLLVIASLHVADVAAQDDAPSWSYTTSHDGIVYLMSDSDSRIDRYDLANESWLQSVTTPDQPTAISVDATGLVVAIERTLYSVDDSSSQLNFLANTSSDITSLASTDSTLYVATRGRPNFDVRLRSTGELIQSREFFDTYKDIVYSSVNDSIIALDTGVSPSEIYRIDLSEELDYLANQDSPYHGAYEHGDRLWLFPNEDRVLDSSGAIYSISDLNWDGDTASSVDGAVLGNDQSYVLSDGVIKKLDSQYREVERLATHENASALFAHSHKLFAFYLQDGSAEVSIVNKDAFSPFTPDPIETSELDFETDDVVRTRDGDLWIVAADQHALVHYSVAEERYTRAIALRGSPTAWSPASDNNSIFLGYDNGEVTQLDTLTETENVIVNLSSAVYGLLAIGNELLTSDSNGAWGSFRIFDLNGNMLASEEWRNPTDNFLWISSSERIIRADYSNLVAEGLSDGMIVQWLEGESNWSASFEELTLSPDESLILANDGRIYDSRNLTLSNSIGVNYRQATWSAGGFIATIKNTDEYGSYWWEPNDRDQEFELQLWGDDYAPLRKMRFQARQAYVDRTGTAAVLFADIEGGTRTLAFQFDADTTDIDGDGVEDGEDAYPLDPDRSSPEPEVGTDVDATTDSGDNDLSNPVDVTDPVVEPSNPFDFSQPVIDEPSIDDNDNVTDTSTDDIGSSLEESNVADGLTTASPNVDESVSENSDSVETPEVGAASTDDSQGNGGGAMGPFMAVSLLLAGLVRVRRRTNDVFRALA